MEKLKNNRKIFILISLAFLFLIYKIDKPFIGHHDWNSIFFANIAKNTAKFGFLKTKFGAVSTFLPTTESDFAFHTHQPPILHLLLGLEAKLIGVREWSMRFLMVIFSLVALYFFFKIGEFLFNQKIAFVASLFFIFNPMFLYFGKLPVHETIGLSFVAFSIYRYIIFFQKENKKTFFYLILSLILACQTVWTGYYLAPLFIIHYSFFKQNKSEKRKILFIIIIPLASFLSHLLHSFILIRGWDSYLFSTLLFRMQIGRKAARYSFTLLQYIKQEALWLTVFFTRILCFLNLIYYFLIIKKIIRRKINSQDGFLILITVLGFIDPIIFRNLCFIHDYKLYYFLLSIPLLAAVSLFYLKEKLEFIWKRSNFVSFCLFCLIFILFVTERIEFTKVLLDTSMNKPAYDLGLIIKEKSNPEEAILIGSESFAEFLGLFLNFYGQRRVVYFEPNLEEFERINLDQGKLIVFVKGREKPSQELLDFLGKKYFSFQTKDFLFFDLKSR